MMSDDEEGSLKDFIDDDEDESEISSYDSDKSFHSSASEKKSAPRRTRATAKECKYIRLVWMRCVMCVCGRCNHRLYYVVVTPEPEIEEPKKENPTEWWMSLCAEEELNNLEHSGKLMLLFSILAECEACGDKLLVFSQSLYSLDVIEHFLSLIDDNTRDPNDEAQLGGYTGAWTQGLDYFRLDGSTNIENRNSACKQFNAEANTRAR